LTLKITASVFWFGPQNQAGYDLSVVPENQWDDEDDAGTHQDLAACFTWKPVGLGFPSLASGLVEARRGWCTWHHHGGCVEVKSKTDGLLRQTASDSATLTLPLQDLIFFLFTIWFPSSICYLGLYSVVSRIWIFSSPVLSFVALLACDRTREMRGSVFQDPYRVILDEARMRQTHIQSIQNHNFIED
jgi:hypothetical protein